MAFWQSPGVVWFEHTGENAVGYACAAALGALPGVATHTNSWLDVLTAAGIGALTAVLTAGAALRVGNGTASFLPRVVAARPEGKSVARPPHTE